jgi:PAS domain S-box-containing protein
MRDAASVAGADPDPGPDMQDQGASGELLAAIVRSSLDCILVIDESGRLIEFNPAAERVFGHARAEVIGQPIAELIVPHRHRSHHAAGMARYLAGGEARMMGRRISTHALRADGSEFPVELTIAEVWEGDRRLFTASLRDLSEQEAIERARRDSEERLAAFLRHAPVGMYLKGPDGRYRMVNPEMTRVVGRPEQEIVGRSADELFSPDEAAMIGRHDAEIRATLQPKAVEEFLDDRDRYAWSLVMRFPVIGPDGISIAGFDIDISEQKRAEAELQRSRDALHQAEKLAAMGSLLAGVSHELNNPLAAVIGQAIMLEEDLAGQPHAARAAKIRSAAERCGRIVQTFLAMARQRPANRTPLCLNDVLANALELTEYSLRSTGIRVERRLDPDLPLIIGDADQLHQAVVNLIINAQQALDGVEGDRRLTVQSEADGDGVHLHLADNGPGVPRELQGRIFEPFFTTKPTGAGTGIGLSFALGIVEAHQGRISLMPSDRGAHFRLSFPIASSQVTRDGELIPAPSGSSLHVLVVDDEADVAETLCDLLKRDGYLAELALSAADARAAMATRQFDILLTDLKMPGEDGAALFRWLETAQPALAQRTIFVTGDTLGGSVEEFLHMAKRPTLEKPFTRASVRAVLAELAT